MQAEKEVRITAAEKAVINKAVQIMRRKCMKSKMCHACPVRSVYCEKETTCKASLPMFWAIPFK